MSEAPAMIEREVVFASAGLRLAGTLALPDGSDRCACVLMITGSGMVDRNESHKRMPLNVMGELAVCLAEQGIGSLRYDKRGVGESEGDFWPTGFHDNVADAAAALAFLSNHQQVRADKIFALGHSEGAYIATRLAAGTVGSGDAAAGSGLAGAVLLAGGARLGEEELHWQGAQVAASLTGFNAWLVRMLHIDIVKSQRKALEKVKRSQKDWYRSQLVAKANAKWMKEFLAYDPASDLSRIQVPILAITGAKDIQVDPNNLARMAELVTASFEAHVVPDVTHLLRTDSGRGGLAAYKEQMKRPVDLRVKDLIVGWLRRQVGAV